VNIGALAGVAAWQFFAFGDLPISATSLGTLVASLLRMNRHEKSWALAGSLLIAALALVSAPATATTLAAALHPHADILQTAIAKVQPRAPRAQIEAQTIDPRVQLRACAVPLAAEMPLGISLGARLNIRVRCTAPAAWSLIVPVTIHTETAVWVANTPIRADEIIRAQHLRRESRRFAGTDDCCIRDAQEVIGKVLRRPVAAGSILQRADVETADVVKRGEIVTIVAGGSAIEVRASGVALADAKPGEPVRIRHSESLRIVQARADSEGIVRVP